MAIIKSIPEKYMKEALKQAKKAYALGEVPIGCVIVHEGKIIGRGYNRRNTDKNTLAHAEITAINKASKVIGDWRLEECTPILEALSEAGFRAVKAGQDTNVGQNHNAEQGMEAKDTSESGVVDDESYVIAIDGRCASGKTTMAQMLAELTGAGVVHMDDFFLPMELRTPERLQEPGGNVHYERVLEEVLPYISKTEGFSYGRFDCGQMGIAGRRFVEAGNLRIVEGAYSCHPKLGDYMSLRVFSDVDASVQLERIKDRDGENALKAYRERWIPMEEAYLETYDIRVMADIVL